ncbi:MAG: 1-acyl-sn-glycerol-3-phosphate acyltransferase [Trueperaceae bacterium]
MSGARPRALWASLLERAIAASLPGIMRRALRRGLAGIWARAEAPVPTDGAVVVANHHSWWDAYLAWAVADHHGRPSGAIMDEAQLARFRFFRHLGVVSDREPRAAARRAAAGAWLVVYVEGGLRPPGPLGPVRPGAAAIARWAGVPVLPLAIRCVMRGGERPEVYLRFGAPLASGVDHETLARALADLLERLDRDLAAATDAEAPVPDYRPWWRATERSHERLARWRAWWGAS